MVVDNFQIIVSGNIIIILWKYILKLLMLRTFGTKKYFVIHRIRQFLIGIHWALILYTFMVLIHWAVT